ncbi:MAG: decaprenyl-phosphate phosphoribosyltransferase [Alphaproteobacteria bacterium]
MYPSIRLLRPKQWIKNGFVFAPLLFAGQFQQPGAWQQALLAALCFLSISCVVYVINDIRDRIEDTHHPVKRNRPLAAGELTVATAWMIAGSLALVALALLANLPPACTNVAALYVGLNILYTLQLKHVAIADIFFIAFCYVLRVLMGAYALAVAISPWIILSTFTLALFLGFGKRYHEIAILAYVEHKPNLRQYSREFLDRLVIISGCSALMSYAIYAAELAAETGKVELIYTVGFVAFGLFRYMQSIYVRGLGGEPETIILTDRAQLVNLTLWLATTLWVLF